MGSAAAKRGTAYNIHRMGSYPCLVRSLVGGRTLVPLFCNKYLVAITFASLDEG